MTYTVEPAKSSLGHLPAGERWAFDESVTNVFTDMLVRSIPQYQVMRQSVFEIGKQFVQPGTEIVDLGCALGDALAPFIEHYGAANSYVGTDVSAPMLTAARARFAREIDAGLVRLLDTDLRKSYPDGPASLTLSIFTLQFTPLEHRHRILRDIHRNMLCGGALILTEKILGSSAEIGRVMVDLYHRYKEGNGYSAEEIERKRLALEGVLVPVTAKWNEEMLQTAGFQHVDCFWRWMNFAGWIAVKAR
jgi:tRNA (cmo5U34)-methyltransferase